MKTITVDEFWQAAARTPVSYFVGSAISLWRPSDLPGAAELVHWVIGELLVETPLEAVKERFGDRRWPRLESVLQELHYCVGDPGLETLGVLGGTEPNRLHRLVGESLAQTGIAYTTNQDELIESALVDGGKIEGRDYVRWMPGMRWPGRALPVLVKLHGTVGDMATIRTTLEQVHQGLPAEVAAELAADLSTRTLCFLGYSGNDIDIRPILRAARMKRAYWLSRSPGGLPRELADAGQEVVSIVGDLASFLPGKTLDRAEAGAAPSKLRSVVSRMDPFLRACAVSRCVGLSASDDAALHDECIRAVRRFDRSHEERWRVWYDAGERRHRRAGALGGIPSFVRYWIGWRTARGRNPEGALLCLRGMWMSIDLLALGLLRVTYLPGAWLFAPRARRLLGVMPAHRRSYYEGLVDLLELRCSLRLARVKEAEALARKLVTSSSSSPHLRGHGLRFLARVLALRGEHDDVEALLRGAVEEFEYCESAVDVRNAHRTGVVCAIVRRNLRAGREHQAAVKETDQPEPRERARNAILGLALRAAEARRWRLGVWLASRI